MICIGYIRIPMMIFEELSLLGKFDHYSQLQDLGVQTLREIRNANIIPWNPANGKLSIVIKHLVDQGFRKGDIDHRLVDTQDTVVEVLHEAGLEPEYPMNNSQEMVSKIWLGVSANAAIKMELLNGAPYTADGKAICYHGSTSDRKSQIIKSGLLPDQKDSGLSQLLRASKKGHVFLCRDRDFAIAYARMYAEERRIKPILVRLEVDPAFMKPDLDIDREDGYKVSAKYTPLPVVAIENINS